VFGWAEVATSWLFSRFRRGADVAPGPMDRVAAP
jgi:hypothetical protein